MVVVVDATQTGKNLFFLETSFKGPKPMKLLAKVNTVQTIFSE